MARKINYGIEARAEQLTQFICNKYCEPFDEELKMILVKALDEERQRAIHIVEAEEMEGEVPPGYTERDIRMVQTTIKVMKHSLVEKIRGV